VSVERGTEALLMRRREILAQGAEPIGWKIGFNVPEIQEKLGIERPLAGFLTSDGLLEDGASWDDLPVVVESEVAVELGADARSIVAMLPALELADPPDLDLGLEQILAGNIFHRAVLLGPPAADATLAGITAQVSKDGEPIGEADVSSVVGDPADTVRFVTDFLEPHGASLMGGEVIIAGSLTPPVPVGPGESFELDLGPLGWLSLGFAD
jgi:2-keto-4-pentenoate hydratase